MNTILIALSNTPIWVYLLFVYLTWVGVRASKTRIIALKKLFIMPAIFTYMSVHTLITSFDIHLFEVSTWMGTILIGILIGYFDVYRNYSHIC